MDETKVKRQFCINVDTDICNVLARDVMHTQVFLLVFLCLYIVICIFICIYKLMKCQKNSLSNVRISLTSCFENRSTGKKNLEVSKCCCPSGFQYFFFSSKILGVIYLTVVSWKKLSTSNSVMLVKNGAFCFSWDNWSHNYSGANRVLFTYNEIHTAIMYSFAVHWFNVFLKIINDTRDSS